MYPSMPIDYFCTGAEALWTLVAAFMALVSMFVIPRT